MSYTKFEYFKERWYFRFARLKCFFFGHIWGEWWSEWKNPSLVLWKQDGRRCEHCLKEEYRPLPQERSKHDIQIITDALQHGKIGIMNSFVFSEDKEGFSE